MIIALLMRAVELVAQPHEYSRATGGQGREKKICVRCVIVTDLSRANRRPIIIDTASAPMQFLCPKLVKNAFGAPNHQRNADLIFSFGSFRFKIMKLCFKLIRS